MADGNDIRISNNAGWPFEMSVVDDDGNPRDLTGATFEMDIRATKAATATLATLTSGNGQIALSDTPVDGRVFINISIENARDALGVGNFYYDLLMTIGAADPELVTWGGLKVLQGVSR